MSHTYYSILAHCVFSTKERRHIIPADMKDKLWPYIAGIARQNQFKAVAVGGMPDHVHVLLSLPTSMSIAKAMQLIKGGSSKWINDHLKRRTFAWQDGYAAFTIGISQVENTVRYIDNQARHHAKMDFAQELKKMLERHGIQPLVGARDSSSAVP
jgi:REP element-mobilizing transposase RayT